MEEKVSEVIAAVAEREKTAMKNAVIAINMLDSRVWAFGVMCLGLAAYLLKQAQAGNMLITTAGVMWQSKSTPPAPPSNSPPE